MRAYIGLGLAFAGGAAVGFLVGNRVTIKALDAKYNEQMELEIARTRAFYERVNKAGDFETPASAAEALGVPVEDAVAAAADAVIEYKGKVDYTKFNVHNLSLDLDENIFTKAAGIPPEEALKVGENREEVVVEEHNVFQDHMDPEDIGFSERNPDHPYLITMLEFAENEEVNGVAHEQLEATYYAGDRVLTDDQDKPIQQPDPVVGLDNLERFGTNRVIYVRNERLKTDYQVNLSDGKYAYEVAGFTHSDETFERRPRRRSADE
jgi:hypothetical protein